MPNPGTAIHVAGTLAADSHGLMLVLSERLDGHDTFLTGQLALAQDTATFGVRILTFDDVTVLRFIADPPTQMEPNWRGLLHLPHGLRPRTIPEDLDAAAASASRDPRALDAAELRYALTFLDEAATHEIRQGRIDAIVSALPAKSAVDL